MMWIEATQIIQFQGLKPQHLNLDKDDTTGLETMVSEWITQCQSLIETHINRTYSDSEVPAAVQNVLLRLTSNMVTLAIQRRDSPIVKVNDWNIQTISSDIFSDDLKNDLKPFVKDASNDYSKIGFFAITGADTDGGSQS